MSIRRIGVLLGKELLQGPKNFIIIWVLVAPIAVSLVLSLVFGDLFSGKAKLGIVDEGSSQLVTKIEEVSSVAITQYGSVSEVTQAVESGAIDVGIVLPENFDGLLKDGERVGLTSYVWGESLAKNRTVVGVTLANMARELAGQSSLIEIEEIALGDTVNVPWNDRLLPLVVLMAVILAGAFIPATSLVEEKEKNTLQAVAITPTSLADVFLAKGLLGIILGLVMGIVMLLLNQAFGVEPVLLVLVLGLGAILAAEFGLVAGMFMKDMTTLFAVWKSVGIVIFAPAIVYMFPEIPEWVGRLFPTYYLIQPVVEISLGGGGWPEIATSVLILIAMDIALIGIVLYALRRTPQMAV